MAHQRVQIKINRPMPESVKMAIKDKSTKMAARIVKTRALLDPKWIDHKIGDTYTMDNKPDLWKIAYYPIFEHGKTKEKYVEPRALVEKPISGGIDFREIPLRYLTKQQTL